MVIVSACSQPGSSLTPRMRLKGIELMWNNPQRPQDPRIGVLMREGRTVYYAFVRGYGQPATEGSLETVEAALGLRRRPPGVAGNHAPVRSYVVTVTPKMLTYGSHGVNGPYDVTVLAKSRAEAIQRARRDRWLEEGRHGVPATYRARLEKEPSH